MSTSSFPCPLPALAPRLPLHLGCVPCPPVWSGMSQTQKMEALRAPRVQPECRKLLPESGRLTEKTGRGCLGFLKEVLAQTTHRAAQAVIAAP